MADPYTDPATGVLRNLLGIRDPDELSSAEADITAARLTRLDARQVRGRYDLAHLQAFHREIFGSIYPWAGQIRTVEIAKNTSFCPVVNIPSYANDVFRGLVHKKYLRELPRESFIDQLADLYGDVNALHPFREGNGRTQRAFLTQLAADAGHPIDWTGMDAERNRLASIASFNGNTGPLRTMLADLVAPESVTRPENKTARQKPARVADPAPQQPSPQPSHQQQHQQRRGGPRP